MYILPECGCKIAATLRKRSPVFGDTRNFEKIVWFEHICEMHYANMKDEYINNIRMELEKKHDSNW